MELIGDTAAWLAGYVELNPAFDEHKQDRALAVDLVEACLENPLYAGLISGLKIAAARN